MNYNQPQCESCWIDANAVWEPHPEKENLRRLMSLRMPIRTGDHHLERCAWCGQPTISNIYVRADPTTLPYPTEDREPQNFNVAVQCPSCGAMHDGALQAQGEGGPDDGSVGVCLDCEAVFFYETSQPGGTRLPTADELAVLMQEEGVQRALAVIRRVRSRKDG